MPELVPKKQEQEYRATGTDDCSGNCPKTLHETVQNGASHCEEHGRNRVPNKKINPAKVRGYAGQCDALPKAGERIRTADIHVGNVTTRPHNDSESPIIGDIGKGVAKTVASSVQDAQLQNIVENWSTLPEHIKLTIQSLINSVGEDK